MDQVIYYVVAQTCDGDNEAMVNIDHFKTEDEARKKYDSYDCDGLFSDEMPLVVSLYTLSLHTMKSVMINDKVLSQEENENDE